jgi:transcription elongation factor Elf1
MDQTKLIQLCEILLGSGKKQSKGEYLFFCPACNHYKKKLIVKLDNSYKSFGAWHCWVCGDYDNTKGKNLWTLFKRFKASPSQMEELNELLGERRYISKRGEQPKKFLSLPKDFISLYGVENTSDLDFRRAMVYINKRKISYGDIIKYQIGYCKEGEYKNRIIIPSFDEDNKINFFSARSYYEERVLKYKNPKTEDGWSKDIIGFENMINWQMPVVLCEGVFDAIAIRRNAIPLFGKTIMGNLHDKIITNRPPKIYISLDPDAKKNIAVIVETYLKEGIETHIVELGAKDPASIGFQGMTRVIKHQTIRMDFSHLMKYKVGLV